MTNARINQLGTLAAETTMKSAAEYIHQHDLKVADYTVASDILRSYCKQYLDIALNDAKEAFECGMDAIGQQTFLATMRLAGIEAAKEFARPDNYVA